MMKYLLKALSLSLILCLLLGTAGFAEGTDAVTQATAGSKGRRPAQTQPAQPDSGDSQTDPAPSAEPAQSAEPAPLTKGMKGRNGHQRPSGQTQPNGSRKGGRGRRGTVTPSAVTESLKAFSDKGVISAETCQKISDYLVKHPANDLASALKALLDAQVITEAEYSAMTAAPDSAAT